MTTVAAEFLHPIETYTCCHGNRLQFLQFEVEKEELKHLNVVAFEATYASGEASCSTTSLQSPQQQRTVFFLRPLLAVTASSSSSHSSPEQQRRHRWLPLYPSCLPPAPPPSQ